MTALFTALIIVPFLRKWALDQGNLDIPDERKVHVIPMFRLGGVAIFLSYVL
jgi:UDP-GlcNAc:undecaprenyl-phosphate GlcNAc-1-phosphate transferase